MLFKPFKKLLSYSREILPMLFQINRDNYDKRYHGKCLERYVVNLNDIDADNITYLRPAPKHNR